MADITMFVPAGTQVTVVDGTPPTDRSAEIAALTVANAVLQAKIDAARGAAQAAKDRDAASVEGQSVLDALA